MSTTLFPKNIYVVSCAIWYHLYNLKNAKNTHVIGIKEFEQIKWLPVSERFNQHICSNAFNFLNENCPLYLHDLYKPSGQDKINIRFSFLKLQHPLKVQRQI